MKIISFSKTQKNFKSSIILHFSSFFLIFGSFFCIQSVAIHYLLKYMKKRDLTEMCTWKRGDL